MLTFEQKERMIEDIYNKASNNSDGEIWIRPSSYGFPHSSEGNKEILDLQNPYPIENREFSEQENKIAENVLIALEELGKWKKKNHLK